MTSTIKPETPKSYETASQKAGTAIYTGNMSQIQTSFRTISTPESNTSHSTRRPASRTHQLHSHSEPQTCCMHVHQQQSQTCKMGEPPALREVKHPHRDRTSVSRSPSTEQEVLSQFSGYSEEIKHFTRDPYKPQLKSCLQSTKHAPKKQEVNTHTDWVHSNRERMEHTGHFPAHREVCMSDHLTQTTERTQGQHLLPDFIYRHAEFPSDMESAPNFPGKQILQGNEAHTPDFLGNQFQQENEKTIDTGTRISPTNEQIIPVTHKEPHIPSRPLKTMAHRYRHTEKEVHLLSEPSELQPLKAMAHGDTRKEAHLLSGLSELQLTEDSETQKFDSAHVLAAITDPRQEYSRSTETNKAKFQNPFIYNDDRNFVRHNSVNEISPNLVFMTTQNTASVSNSVFCRKKGRKHGRCRDSRNHRRTCTCSHTGDSP